jgi:glutamine amidotransferase
VSSRTPEVLLVDFGMGNLRSVLRALERAGAKARIASSPDEVRQCDRVILPGVGAAGDAMRALRARGFDAALQDRLTEGRPYLGLCLGLQLLLESAEEGEAHCLGILSGRVARFPRSHGLPIPHMGWNLVEPVRAHPLIERDYFYFVHAYRPTGVPEASVVARTEYGERFASALGLGSWFAVQFHPEKSQRAGLRLLERFIRWSP